MANARTLAQLHDEELIERRVVGSTQVRQWIRRSRMDLELASHAASTGDLERAMTLVYEAGLRACIALLGTAGYRLRSVEGHHRAALEAAVAIAGAEVEIPVSRLDDARRQRNQSLYGTSRPVGADELKRLTKDVEDLIGRVPSRGPGVARDR
ncbi:MAG TPA: hypothetical protein VGR46_10900 [Candidatus Limnocylindria bacterium]|jgi:hypothetical protein|nr:hypothetical protein [Candidatus Limnocylindria bacterium]